MKCANCGAEIKLGCVYCSVCGKEAQIVPDYNVAVSYTHLADVLNYIVGTLVAAVVGYICIKTMLVVVRKKKFTIFSIYCLIMGLVSIGGYFYM